MLKAQQAKIQTLKSIKKVNLTYWMLTYTKDLLMYCNWTLNS